MTLQKIDSTTRVADQVFDVLLGGVLSGHFSEGDRLRIRNLADELGTSVMPVREAIRRLEEMGLAEAVPYRGAVIKRLTREELLNLYEVRRLVEIEAARLGASNIRPTEVARLKQELGSMEQAVADKRPVEYLDHDENLLMVVYRASGNPVLTETIRSLWHRCRSYKIVGANKELDTGDPGNLSVHQKALVQAAESGDGPLAADVTAASIDAAIERIRVAMDE